MIIVVGFVCIQKVLDSRIIQSDFVCVAKMRLKSMSTPIKSVGGRLDFVDGQLREIYGYFF
jgi:hypothetical protein